MRISLQLRTDGHSATVPLNYQYPLSAAIYKILRQASPEYAAFLHDQGYAAPSGRLMKLFTFSKLWIPGGRKQGRWLRGSDGVWRLQIGSAMQEEFVQNFVLGLFETARLTIMGLGARAELNVEQVEALPAPSFEQVCRFKCLSPIAASTMREHNGKLQPYYYRPYDAGLSGALHKNLLEKYQIIHGRQKATFSEKVAFPGLQFRLEAQDKPKSKLITIKEGTPQATQIKGFETYFTLEGSSELMQVAWDCGLGEHNSQGFGMLDVVG